MQRLSENFALKRKVSRVKLITGYCLRIPALNLPISYLLQLQSTRNSWLVVDVDLNSHDVIIYFLTTQEWLVATDNIQQVLDLIR